MLPIERSELSESNGLDLFTGDSRETAARRRKETAYTTSLKLKTLPEKVIELEKACFFYQLAILH